MSEPIATIFAGILAFVLLYLGWWAWYRKR